MRLWMRATLQRNSGKLTLHFAPPVGSIQVMVTRQRARRLPLPSPVYWLRFGLNRRLPAGNLL